MMAGAPMDAVLQLIDVGLFFVPVNPNMASRISSQYPYLVPGKIPANVYPGVPDTPTLQVHALLVVGSTLSDDIVYQMTAALWSDRTRSLLENGHPQGKAITIDTALDGISIPLHPGAERYYREKGMLQKGDRSQ